MSLRQLETLVAVAETGSFQAAAERLGLTQSAISMQMKGLEDELGRLLFDRARRPPALNASGARLVPRAREILRLYAAFGEAARDDVDVAGSLRLGVIPTASTGMLPDALAALNERYPRLAIRIENGLTSELVPRIADGRLDAALVTEVGRLERGLVCRTVVEERLMVVAPAGSATAGGDAALLSALPFIRFNRATGVGRIIEQGIKARRIRVNETMELDSIESILAMVSRGLGVTVAPEGTLTPPVAAGLVCLPFGAPALTRRVGLLERRSDRPSPLTGALYTALCDIAGGGSGSA